MGYLLEAKLNLFLSTFETKIDKKGRISIPARYRSLLEKSEEELILFSTPESNYVQGCGNNYIKRLWETNLELDQISNEALYIQDILSDSIHAKIDAEGRVLITENFINVADLEKTILFAGRGETFQIWNPEKYTSEKEERSKRFKMSGPQTLMLKKNNELSNEKNK